MIGSRSEAAIKEVWVPVDQRLHDRTALFHRRRRIALTRLESFAMVYDDVGFAWFDTGFPPLRKKNSYAPLTRIDGNNGFALEVRKFQDRGCGRYLRDTR